MVFLESFCSVFLFYILKISLSIFSKTYFEHILKKMGSTEIVMSSVRLSVCPSVRLSVTYFSAGIVAPRELKF
jgi:hypothetical protein